MKKYLLLLMMVSVFSLNAQDENPFARNGKFFIETGFSFSNILLGGSSGFGVLIEDGDFTIINLSMDAGVYISDNFAVKGSLNFTSLDGESIFGLSGGVKWYPGGRFILNPSFGFISVDSEVLFKASLFAGYSIPLANNIHLEPKLGLSLLDDASFFEIRVPFVLLF